MNVERVEQLDEAGAGSQLIDSDGDVWTKRDDGQWTLDNGRIVSSAKGLLIGGEPLRFSARFYTSDEPTLSTVQQTQLRDEIDNLRTYIIRGDLKPEGPQLILEAILERFFPEKYAHAFDIPPGAEGMK